MQIKQQEVLDIIAKPVIEASLPPYFHVNTTSRACLKQDVLQGVNGTIFAYGQTGCGRVGFCARVLEKESSCQRQWQNLHHHGRCFEL